VLQIWDVASGTEQLSVPEALSFAFSEDGNHIAVGANKGDVVLYDAAMKEMFRAKSEAVFGLTLAFSPDGKSLIGSSDVLVEDSYEGHLLFWNVADGQLARTFRAHKGHVTYVAYAPDGRAFA
ncbi:MAG: hypothetical protein NTU83_08635, partial [Candidatus Hydrogenedentes bacterium]|nr:hypothetical protein [Candidatus Hydrogenedentota bacterium]